mmetsp:Transcript_8155/g.20260  ORF Transcript_8155/g.20260 Transcript_8155/m.20260 type:complete len:208 (+) Transcript_8155:17-640(+)|eukprot:CAMPEP_0206279086 /NCGR_PEP_ID=MMETSP0047_2-20121206/37838_1 /ASSEMBLY_ACC=CAM_ASM_000192 /TAXON_ID=195065 /ORGANISM="Chroomonas mesostigmatica_cf, Strain CCMP1168" /LENGTH=207 /DNA_ID=CAMNT_0053709019 /DNA_START=15 /DNA_END=638 /DNA_ORIENTATION=+
MPMLRNLLVLALVAAASGQRCLTGIPDYTIASGPCQGVKVSLSGGYCLGAGYETVTADNAGETLGAMMAGVTVDTDASSCELTCTMLSGSVRSGACSKDTICKTHMEQAFGIGPRTACTVDSECQAEVQINGDMFRKDAVPYCCSAAYAMQIPCDGMPDLFKDTFIEAFKLAGGCKEENCYGAASSLCVSLLAPLLAAAAALFATRM